MTNAAQSAGDAIDPLDLRIHGIREVEIALRVEGEIHRFARGHGGRRLAFVARFVVVAAVPGEGGDQAGLRIDAAHQKIRRIGDEQVPRAIDEQSRR